MAVLHKRSCDLCGNEIPEGDVVGQLWLPGGTPAEIHARVQADVEHLNPLVLMTQPNVVQELHRKHQGQKWDVCKSCVEGLTRWSAHRLLAWMAAGFHRTQEGD